MDINIWQKRRVESIFKEIFGKYSKINILFLKFWKVQMLRPFSGLVPSKLFPAYGFGYHMNFFPKKIQAYYPLNCLHFKINLRVGYVYIVKSFDTIFDIKIAKRGEQRPCPWIMGRKIRMRGLTNCHFELANSPHTCALI